MFDVRSWFAAFRRQALPGALGDAQRAIATGRFDQADAALDVALDQARTGRERAIVHNKRGVAYVGAQDRDRALHAFAEALRCDPACAPALTNLGNLLLEEGHPQDARDFYAAAIAADEGYALAHRNLGIALRRLGKRAQSVSALRKADRLENRAGRRRA